MGTNRKSVVRRRFGSGPQRGQRPDRGLQAPPVLRDSDGTFSCTTADGMLARLPGGKGPHPNHVPAPVEPAPRAGANPTQEPEQRLDRLSNGGNPNQYSECQTAGRRRTVRSGGSVVRNYR